jgi:Domain of unknown function (DUF5753)
MRNQTTPPGHDPSWFREWPSIEREVLTLRSWELAVVPGMLETAAYARAVLRAVLPDATDEEVAAQAVARLERQEILRRQDPPILWAILDEGALRRRVGDRTIMHQQLSYLIETSQNQG